MVLAFEFNVLIILILSFLYSFLCVCVCEVRRWSQAFIAKEKFVLTHGCGRNVTGNAREKKVAFGKSQRGGALSLLQAVIVMHIITVCFLRCLNANNPESSQRHLSNKSVPLDSTLRLSKS